MKKLPKKERLRLLSIGFKQCPRCMHVYHKDFYNRSQFQLNGRCYLCDAFYAGTGKFDKSGKPRKSPGQRVRERFMETCGHRRCDKCSITLPVTEYSGLQTTCNECAKKSGRIKNYLAGFGLRKCSTCMGYRERHKFYRRPGGKYTSYCRDCEADRLLAWRSNNPVKYRNNARNGAGRRRARIRNLYHKPITGEEYEILRAQRIKIFGE